MEIDNITSTRAYREARRVSRRALIQQAVGLAMQSRWEEAAEINQQIVEMTPADAETHNRLGKAFREMGRIGEARTAYERALKSDPANAIALRSLEALSHITDAEVAEMTKRAGQKLDPRFFMEETGKTGVTSLNHVAATEILATLSAGDSVVLQETAGNLVVNTIDGVPLGHVEDTLAVRLTRLMQTGNKYQGGVVGVERDTIRIMIREVSQSQQNSGRISFPPRTDSMPRPYLREGLMRRATEEEDEDDMEGEPPEDAGDDDDDDASEFGFREKPLDEN